MNFESTVLYKLDTKGQMRQWKIEDDSFNGQYRVVTGLVKGKKVTSEWTKAIPTNVGRANMRNSTDQAKFEIDALIAEKKHEGYSETEDDANVFDKPFEPMLAEKYAGWDKLKTAHVYGQPKLDGMRCNASAKGLMSRGNKPIVAVPHIWEAVQPFIERGWVLDGELYNHDYKADFNAIISLVKKSKPTAEDLAASAEKIQYHIYDIFDPANPDMPFKERMHKLANLYYSGEEYKTPLRAVETIDIFFDEELELGMSMFLSEGYEGIMIRNPEGVYEQKRSKNLLKYKPKGTDEEVIIETVMEGTGNWSGKAKMIGFTYNGKPAKATIKGTMEYCADVWANRDAMVGKKATIWYQNLTPDGVPRFPIAKELDRQDA